MRPKTTNLTDSNRQEHKIEIYNYRHKIEIYNYRHKSTIDTNKERQTRINGQMDKHRKKQTNTDGHKHTEMDRHH